MKSLEKIFLKGLYKKFIILVVVHLATIQYLSLGDPWSTKETIIEKLFLCCFHS